MPAAVTATLLATVLIISAADAAAQYQYCCELYIAVYKSISHKL